MNGFAFDHVHLRSRDPDAAARFYVERLGACAVDRIDTPDMLRVVLDLGGVPVFVERVPEGAAPGPIVRPHRGLEHIAIRVPDLDAAAAALRQAGVAFTLEPKTIRPGLRIAFVLGPDDVSIELLERRT